MSVSLVANRYAKALLDLGVAEGRLDKVVEEFDAVARVWDISPDLRKAVENPLISHAEKKSAIEELAKRLGVSPTTRNTLLLLIDRRRAQALPAIARALNTLADARKGVVRAEVTTAATLAESYYSRLQSQLESMTGQRVLLERRTDPGLIAGVVTRIGDRVFDGSLRARLETLREALMPLSG
ncbi:MAG: ATP synthase F1 subunit delta [Polyangiaceae bacterium]